MKIKSGSWGNKDMGKKGGEREKNCGERTTIGRKNMRPV